MLALTNTSAGHADLLCWAPPATSATVGFILLQVNACNCLLEGWGGLKQVTMMVHVGTTTTQGAAGHPGINARRVTTGLAVPATIALGNTVQTAVDIRALASCATAWGRTCTCKSTCRMEKTGPRLAYRS